MCQYSCISENCHCVQIRSLECQSLLKHTPITGLLFSLASLVMVAFLHIHGSLLCGGRGSDAGPQWTGGGALFNYYYVLIFDLANCLFKEPLKLHFP